MRLVAGAVALTLFASYVRADSTVRPEPARPSGGSGATPATSPAASSAASAASVTSSAASAAASSAMTRSKVPLRVIRVMPETHQALLYDRSRATHVIA